MAAAQLLQDIDGVRNCFRAEEVRIIERINEIERSGKKIAEDKKEMIKNVIRQLNTKIEQKQQAVASAAQTDATHMTRMKEIQVSKTQVKGKLDELLAEKTELEANLQQLESGSGDLSKRRQSITRTFEEELPQKKWIVKLYHKLTNVRWEIPAPANEITGFVYTETDGDSTPMPFSFSEKKCGTVAQADELWGMIARS